MELRRANQGGPLSGSEDVFRGGPDERRVDDPSTANLRESALHGRGGGRTSGAQYVQKKLAALVHTVVPPGGILSGAFNMASCAIGAGILGLPGATNKAGLVSTVTLLVLITFLSVFSMYIMVLAAYKTNIRSFEGMARWLFPKGHYAFSYWAAFIRFFNGFSACIAYVICVGNLLSPIFKEAYKRNPDNGAIRFLNTTGGNRLLTILVWLCCMLPLMIPKHVDSLRYASTFAVSFLVYFSIVVFFHSCMHGLKDIQGHVKVDDRGGDVGSDERIIYLFRTGNIVLGSIGVFIFSYICHGAVYEIWWDMRPEIRTPRNFAWSLSIGLTIAAVIYMITAVFGYLDFGSTIGSSSILLMYNPINEPQVMVAYVGIMVKLCVSYALLGATARNSIYYLIGWQKRFGNRAAVLQGHQQGKALTNAVELQPQDEATMQVPTDEVPSISTEEDTTYIDNIPFMWHLIVVLIFSVVSLLCGLFIPKINTVFGFAGSVSGGFLGFIFPALFYMYAGGFTVEREGRFNYYTTYLLLMCGVIGIVFGLAGTIYGAL